MYTPKIKGSFTSILIPTDNRNRTIEENLEFLYLIVDSFHYTMPALMVITK